MATVNIDGTDHEVALADITLADGEVPTGMVTTAKMTTTIQSEKAKAKRSARTELLTDDEFKAEVLTSYGVELREDGTVKGAVKDSAALEARWKAQHLDPVNTKLTEATTAAERYRMRALEADIVKAATEAGIKPSFLKPAPGQKTAPIVELLKGSFGYDAENDQWAVKDGDSFKFATGGALYGAGDLFNDLRTNADYGDYFASSTMRGSDHKTARDNGGSKTFTQAQIDSMSDADFQANEPAIMAAMAAGQITG